MKVLNTTNKIKLGKKWKDYEVPGTVFDTNYGALTLIKAQRKIHISKTGKKYKYMYYTVTDGQKQFEITRQQLFNKKLPKTATIQTTLMLAHPKELIDQILQEVKQLTLDYNKNNLKSFTLCPKSNKLFDKIQFIAHHTYFIDMQLYKQYKNKILMYYHPDRNPSTDTDFMETLYWIFNK